MFSRRRTVHTLATADRTDLSPSNRTSSNTITDISDIDISDILERARKRESEALGILYRQYLPGVFGYIAARIPDRSIAEDLTSDVFVQVVEHIEQVKATSEASFAAWLFQIARGVVAGYYRKHHKQPPVLSLTPDLSSHEEEQIGYHPVATDTESDPVQWSEIRAEWASVVEAINQLTEDQRQVIIGRLIMGYDVVTVAQMLGKQGNAVKALQFRALQRLQRTLQQQEKELPSLVKPDQARRPARQEDRS